MGQVLYHWLEDPDVAFVAFLNPVSQAFGIGHPLLLLASLTTLCSVGRRKPSNIANDRNIEENVLLYGYTLGLCNTFLHKDQNTFATHGTKECCHVASLFVISHP
jgi:hypothetical protein